MRRHLRNVYASLTLSTVSAGVGTYIQIYTELLSVGLLTLFGSLGFLIALMVTSDNGKNTRQRLGFLLGFSFFAGA